jgi:hypothetical protein
MVTTLEEWYISLRGIMALSGGMVTILIGMVAMPGRVVIILGGIITILAKL